MSAQNAQRQRDRQDELWRFQCIGMLTPSHRTLHRLAVPKQASTRARSHIHQPGLGQPPTYSRSDPSSRHGCSCILPLRCLLCHMPHSQGPWVANIPSPLCLPRHSTLVPASQEHYTLARDLTMGLSMMPRRNIRSSSAAPVALGRDPKLSRTCCMAGGKG